MRGLFTNSLFNIEPGQTVSGVAHSAQTLRVMQGEVWVTVEGIKHDYWLSAGDTFTTIPGRLIVLEASTSSRIDARCARAKQFLQATINEFKGVAQRLFGHLTVQTTLKRHRLCNDAC